MEIKTGQSAVFMNIPRGLDYSRVEVGADGE